MRIIPEIKVECATQQEEEALTQWVENQCYCTVEFNVIARRSEGITYSMTPWGDEPERMGPAFDEFCAELHNFVERVKV